MSYPFEIQEGVSVTDSFTGFVKHTLLYLFFCFVNDETHQTLNTERARLSMVNGERLVVGLTIRVYFDWELGLHPYQLTSSAGSVVGRGDFGDGPIEKKTFGKKWNGVIICYMCCYVFRCGDFSGRLLRNTRCFITFLDSGSIGPQDRKFGAIKN